LSNKPPTNALLAATITKGMRSRKYGWPGASPYNALRGAVAPIQGATGLPVAPHRDTERDMKHR